MESWKENKRFVVPGVFTSFNIILGGLSIFFALEMNLTASAWMIIMAVLFDGLDGKIARWLNGETQFGLQFDSLADLVSSGIAPVILIYQAHFAGNFLKDGWMLMIYIFSGAYRLARFNSVQKGDRSEGYLGLPVPVAGMSLAALYLFNECLSVNPARLWYDVYLMGLSLLMISTIPYAWPKLDFSGRNKSLISVLYLFCVALMIFLTKYSLFPLLFLYIAAGIGRWICDMIHESTEIEIIK